MSFPSRSASFDRMRKNDFSADNCSAQVGPSLFQHAFSSLESDTERLRLDTEFREISEGPKRSNHRKQFQLSPVIAARVSPGVATDRDELLRASIAAENIQNTISPKNEA